MVKKKNVLLIGLVIILIITAIFLTNYYPKKENFSVNTILLKLNIPLDGESINKIKITNNEEEKKFNIYFTNFEGLASITEKEFILKSGESKEIDIYFKDTQNKVGIYLGELIIETSTLKKKIPIILSIEDKTRIFAIIQKSIPKYSNVYPDGKFGADIKIFNLEDNNLHNIKIKYSIKNFENELIFSEEEEIVIKGNLGITKIIDIPKTLPYGEYVFTSSIEYKEIKSASSHLFSVSEKEIGFFSGDLKFFVVIVLIFIGGILILFFYFIKARDDYLLIRLKRQQNKELKRSSELIKVLEENIKKTKKTSQGKKKVKELKKAKKRIVKNIKIKQRKQRKELKKLKKENKKNEIEKRMNDWKKEGYKMFETEKEINKISDKNINKQIKELKKQGFDTSVLDK